MLQYQKILAPVDFAEISNSVLAQAASHSEQSQSKLYIVHIVDLLLPVYASLELMTDVSVQDALLSQAEKHLDHLLDELEIGYCETIVKAGRIVPSLLETISENDIDLVVMGTHNKRGPSENYKSITMAIAEKAACDVLVLHK